MSLLAESIPAPNARDIKWAVIGTAAAIGIGAFIAVGKLLALAALIGIPILIGLAAICLTRPLAGLMIYFNINFFILGLGRFLPDAPYGLLIDLMLVLIFMGIFFTIKRTGEQRLRNPIFYLVLAWFMYTVLLFFNPLSQSQVVWFFAIRGLSLYWLLVVIAGFLLLDNPKHLYWLVTCWLVWSLLGALWSFKQYYIGLTPGEQQWLAEGGAKTHLLFGKQFRAFSFYSDAGQFGADMAHAALFCGIMVIESKNFARRLLFAVLAGVYFWGFAVAGTRGPLFIFFAGLPLYFIIKRNIPLIIVGFLALGLAFSVLKFTRVGQGNYQVLRMRSALNMEDKSLQVRIVNQLILMEYLKDKPFGGGVGSGGDWGRRFSPDSFLGHVALDSWFVKIWVEGGVVGLIFHLLSLIAICIIGFRNVSRLRNPLFKSTMIGIYCGFVGILVASYGNQLFGQHPIDAEMYLTMVFFAICPKLDKMLPGPELEQPRFSLF
ncbi:hypothetical protein BN8_05278 [Fibrisoma limi BUZ 3]|uniref:O-antigen polymerase n=1 Tax=Fibrisoma limi BUZ 3 TaxID=1185876 RepID=I2GQ00_9BACT|nr:hypothetical protein [Fibrisoma limi]CCH55978.1 hypothetical protein BN8_05278 [Fibrisoma limi BUZ 3]